MIPSHALFAAREAVVMHCEYVVMWYHVERTDISPDEALNGIPLKPTF